MQRWGKVRRYGSYGPNVGVKNWVCRNEHETKALRTVNLERCPKCNETAGARPIKQVASPPLVGLVGAISAKLDALNEVGKRFGRMTDRAVDRVCERASAAASSVPNATSYKPGSRSAGGQLSGRPVSFYGAKARR